ncbi:MAG: hypothetical protein KF801_10255 [Cryobacterium sp.]|nr:hypothetical protein [Cryobacterium sp.]
MALAAAGSTLLVIASACGADSVEASEYDQTCSTASDCTLVDELKAEGTTCTIRCASGAINKKEQSRFDKDLATARGDCRQTATPLCDLPGVVACVRERCVIGPAPADAGAD